MSVTVPDIETTLDFVPLFADQTEDAILTRMQAWANEGLDPVADADRWVDTREGGHWHTGVIQCVREFARLYDVAGTEVPMSAFVVWAWGTYLDDLAAVWDVERLPASPAVGIETFTGPSGTEISSGTTIAAQASSPDDPAPSFRVVTDGVIPNPGSGTGSLDLPIQATIAGAAGNVAAGAITEESTPMPDGVTFVNAAATGAGRDPETDDQLRIRVLQATAGKGPGNALDMLRWALAWPGVSTAKVVPTWNGPTTAMIVIGDENGRALPTQTVDDLQTDVDPVAGKGAGTAAVGQQVTIATPVDLVVNITATVTYAEGYSADGVGGTIAVKPDVTDREAAYLLSVQPGDVVALAVVAGEIATHEGVVDVTNVKINGVAANLPVAIGPPPQAPILGTITI